MTALRKAAQTALDFIDALGMNYWGDRVTVANNLRAALAAPQDERSNSGALSWDVAMPPDVAKWITANPPRIEIAPQAEQPEVVAWMYQHDETGRTMITEQPPDRVEPNDLRRWHIVSALYAAPPTCTPLTDEEMFNVIAREVGDDDLTSAIAAGRAVERAHGIVGGGK